MKTELMKKALILLAIVLFSTGCASLTPTQRMERAMFDPPPPKSERVVVRREGVTLPPNEVKMPRRVKR